jgi:hypothetical protein
MILIRTDHACLRVGRHSRGADGRGARRRRQRHSPVAGVCEAEREEALISGGGVG